MVDISGMGVKKDQYFALLTYLKTPCIFTSNCFYKFVQPGPTPLSKLHGGGGGGNVCYTRYFWHFKICFANFLKLCLFLIRQNLRTYFGPILFYIQR